MNRYTYKAKRKDNGEWYFGCLSAYYQGGLTEITGDFGTKEVIKETLCQCTGLQDRDGNYIFENDILPMGTSILDGKEEIIYDTVKYVNGIYEPIAYWKKEVLKVIGNKFDKEVE